MSKQALVRSFFIAVVLVAASFNTRSSAASLAEIKAAAEAGDPAAQDKLAEAFVMWADSVQAESWYRKAAEQGFAHAQGRLGNMLLMRSRLSVASSSASRAAMAEEAVHWITLAANQGDTRGQADFADICLQGKLVKQDLIEAHKWGELASKGSMIDVATTMGRSVRDGATLKMTAQQIAEAQRRVAAFVPHHPKASETPEPAWLKQIKLNGISGPPNDRLAILNGKSLKKGEQVSLKVGEKTVTVSCLEVGESSVVISVDGVDGTQELRMH